MSQSGPPDHVSETTAAAPDEFVWIPQFMLQCVLSFLPITDELASVCTRFRDCVSVNLTLMSEGELVDVPSLKNIPNSAVLTPFKDYYLPYDPNDLPQWFVYALKRDYWLKQHDLTWTSQFKSCILRKEVDAGGGCYVFKGWQYIGHPLPERELKPGQIVKHRWGVPQWARDELQSFEDLEFDQFGYREPDYYMYNSRTPELWESEEIDRVSGPTTEQEFVDEEAARLRNEFTPPLFERDDPFPHL